MVRATLRLLAVASMFALVAPSLALAQQEKDEHKGPPPHPSSGGAPPHPSGPPPHPPGPQFKPAAIPHGPTPGPVGGPPPPAFSHPAGPTPGFAHGPPLGFAHPGGPIIHPTGPQFSYRGRTFDRIHIHPFFYPPGWAYREWAIGAMLPPLFLAPDYYYPEWAALGLEPPPPGCQWVRYGPDLLLVDTSTGQVIDAAYGVFYD
jgi:Nickel/cobalt transporter regulator